MAFGFWLLAVGFWLLAFGCWLLAVGFWLLAFGCWLLAVGFLLSIFYLLPSTFYLLPSVFRPLSSFFLRFSSFVSSPLVVLFLLAIKRKSTKKKNRRSLWTLLKSTAASHTQAKPVGTTIVPMHQVVTASLVACLLKALASEPALIFTQAPQMRGLPCCAGQRLKICLKCRLSTVRRQCFS